MVASLWRAPVADAPVTATVVVPGSKSLTNRYLVLAALGHTPTMLRHPLQARDTLLMAEGLRQLGANVEDLPDAQWLIQPGVASEARSIDCGLAGTVMRFLPPVAALTSVRVSFDGDARARQRPMQPLLQALRTLGVQVEDHGTGGLPFTVTGQGSVTGGEVELDASTSSQLVSGLLLAGCRFTEGVTVRHVGPPLPSLPHIEMTLAVLRQAGIVATTIGPDQWQVQPVIPTLGTVTVEPDLSNATPFLAAAMVTGGTVDIPNWPEHTTQPGAQLPELLARMGGQWRRDSTGTLTLTGPARPCGINADLHKVGELAPVLAALAAVAQGESHFIGLAHLRGHETDRLAALATELNAIGAEVTELPDGLRITPRPLHAGVMQTYHDHRLATAWAVLGLVVPGIDVVDVATTGKTLPDFPSRWLAMLGATHGAAE